MSIVFFGASELGFKCCQALINDGIDIKLIFTIPETFEIKYKSDNVVKKVENVLYKDFNDFYTKYGIKVITIERDIKKYLEMLIDLRPELFVIIGWYYMIPKEILDIPPKGSIAIHASLLPKYRGNAPLVWAIIEGEEKSGISLFYLSDGVDNGDIIAQEEFDIGHDENISQVLLKAELASLKAIRENIRSVLNGTAQRIIQDEKLATYYPKRNPKDGKIDWSWSRERIYNFIRAQTKPYPGAFTIIRKKKVIIWEADIIEFNRDIDDEKLQ